MIFDERLLNDISDDDISNLVQEHQQEDQHLEFKLTIDCKSHDGKFETLCDIVSIANAGGGYLIIGVRDDGKGRAQILLVCSTILYLLKGM
jgi:predicted HTH transcriptional regulator